MEISYGKRLKEILEEKKIKFEQLEVLVNKRWSDSTLQRMTAETRVIYKTDLVFLAKAIGIKLERFTREDVTDIENTLTSRIRLNENSADSLLFAKKLVRIALGVTERVHSLNLLAKVYRMFGRHERARKLWRLAAEITSGKAGYEELSHKMQYNVLYSYYDSGEYFELLMNIKEFEEKAHDLPQLGRILHLKGIALMKIYDYQKAEKVLTDVIDCYTKGNEDSLMLGRALSDLANLKYMMNEFESALDLLVESRRYIMIYDTPANQVLSDKIYAKMLLKLNNTENARKILDDRLASVEAIGNEEAKLLIMRAAFFNITDRLENVLSSQLITESTIRAYAAEIMLIENGLRQQNGDYLGIIEAELKSKILEGSF